MTMNQAGGIAGVEEIVRATTCYLQIIDIAI